MENENMYQHTNLIVEKKPFITSTLEKIMAFVILPVAFIYSTMMFGIDINWNVYFGIFVVAFICISEIFFWNVKRTTESYLFLIMTIVSAVSAVWELGNVWGSGEVAFFTHLFAVYWLLVRSGRLCEGKSSHMFAFDGFMGFIGVPFPHFSYLLQTYKSMVNFKKKPNMSKLIPTLIAGFVGIILLISAVEFLKISDDNFQILVDKFSKIFEIEINANLIWRLIMTVVFAMYFYGLLGGFYREEKDYTVKQGNNLKKSISKLNKVVPGLWTAFIGVFSAIYLVYFVLQASYLFGAFSMILPKEFTYSEYARHGFGEMCAVMVINFILIWCSTRTGIKVTRVLKWACTALIGESLIFAVIAFMKLLMYIVVYGFTPLRLQSVWLITILTFACICILISMHLHKKTAGVWFVGSAALLCALCVM